MTPYAIAAAPDTALEDAADLMRGHVIGCLPVLDGDNLVGIVTITDLLDLLATGEVQPGPGAIRDGRSGGRRGGRPSPGARRAPRSGSGNQRRCSKSPVSGGSSSGGVVRGPRPRRR